MEGVTLKPPDLLKNPNQRFVSFQAGANAGQFIEIGVCALNAGALGISEC